MLETLVMAGLGTLLLGRAIARRRALAPVPVRIRR